MAEYGLPAAVTAPSLGDTVQEYYRQIGIKDQTLFNVELETRIAEEPGVCALLICDGNKLGITNKVVGRLGGDMVMRSIGDTFIAQSRLDAGGRMHDAIYNLTGDEFGIILRGITKQSEVDSYAERLTQAFKQTGFGMSIGGKLHEPGESAAQLLHAADLRMQAIKNEGRQERNLSTPEQIRAAKIILWLSRKNGLDLPDLSILAEVIDQLPLDPLV